MTLAIKIEDLVKPISKSNPVGHNLRKDDSPTSLYYKIKDARTRARNIERKIQQGEADLDATKEWQCVYETAIVILSKHSKDVEIAVWLLESLIRQHEFAGLNFGLQFLYQLLDRYWDDIFPLPDEDGLDTRLAPLVGLNGEDSEGCLIQPINDIPITQGSSVGPFSLWEYQQSLDITKIKDPKVLEKKIEQEAVMPESIKKAVEESTAQFYQELNDNVADCINSFSELNQLLEEKCGKVAPPSSYIKRTLETYQDHIRFIIKDAPFAILSDAASKNSTENLSEETSSENHEAIISNNIDSRESALVLLVKIADLLKKTEPHSPIPYLLDRAVRWGNLPFPELLQEMINDEGARKSVYEMSGIIN